MKYISRFNRNKENSGNIKNWHEFVLKNMAGMLN